MVPKPFPRHLHPTQGCSPRHRSTRPRARPRATGPTPPTGTPGQPGAAGRAQLSSPLAAPHPLGGKGSAPAGTGRGTAPPRHRPHHPLLPVPAAPGYRRDAQGSGCLGRPPKPPLSPDRLQGGLIFEASTPPLPAAPAAVPSVPTSPPSLAARSHTWNGCAPRGRERRGGAEGQVFLHPRLRRAGNKGAIELQPLWSVKQKPLVSTSLPLI